MNSGHAPARSLVVPGALLLTASLTLVGCGQGTDPGQDPKASISARQTALDSDSGYEQRKANLGRYEDVVTACMKEEGFTYSPELVEPVGLVFLAISSEEGEEEDPVADAKKRGYGITPAGKEDLTARYSPASKEDLIAQYDLDDVFDDTTAGIADDGSGPNDAYYRSLSASSRAAYDEALYGPRGENHGEAEYSWKTAGCHGRANHEVFEDRVPDLKDHMDSTVMYEFGAETDEKVANDPRVLEANAAWVSCMADNGYDFASSDDAQWSIWQRLDALVGVTWSDGTLVYTNLDQVSDEEITALRDDEIATATADAQCVVDTDRDTVYDDVYSEAETEFYNTHKTEVDAWFAAEEALRS